MPQAAIHAYTNMEQLTFAELDLSPEIVQALALMGFEAPTPIQAQTIPLVRSGRDVLGQAQTGTGKTAAFGIPAIEKAGADAEKVQVLILTPTRELAIQVTGELQKLGQFKPGLHIVPVYGGQPIDRQLKALRRRTQIVVGTPGRVIDHLERGTLDLSGLEMVVLDEADEMLNMGFREDIERIYTFTKEKPQSVMFSATVSAPIRDIINRQMTDPATVRIDKTVTTAPNIRQYVVEVRDSMRTEAISRLMDVKGYKLGLVFTNTKMQADDLMADLAARGYDCDVLHGDMKQSARDFTMSKFRKGELDLLIATDVAARGIDVDDIDVVFNYDIPNDPEYYVHRIGRTGRAGRSGTAITFSTRTKARRLQFIERNVRTTLERMNLPSVQEVEGARASEYLLKIRMTLEAGGLRPYIEMIESMGEGPFSHIEVAAAALKLQIAIEEKAEADSQREFREPRGDRFERGGFRDRDDRGDRGDRGPRREFTPREPRGDSHHEAPAAGWTRLYVGAGRQHGVFPKDLVGAIAGEAGIQGKQIGAIKILGAFSLVDVDASVADRVVRSMERATIKGKPAQIRHDRNS